MRKRFFLDSAKYAHNPRKRPFKSGYFAVKPLSDRKMFCISVPNTKLQKPLPYWISQQIIWGHILRFLIFLTVSRCHGWAGNYDANHSLCGRNSLTSLCLQMVIFQGPWLGWPLEWYFWALRSAAFFMSSSFGPKPVPKCRRCGDLTTLCTALLILQNLEIHSYTRVWHACYR